jgi:hypothetical protein
MRRAKKRDESEKAIVDALRNAGAMVFRELPCDLLIYHKGRFMLMECKTPTKTGKQRKRKDQRLQQQFLELTKTPVVLTPFEALLALGEAVSL